MKRNNILDIFKNDFRSLTSSVVTIVILIGLIVLPCLYAWFNILSNWDPYGEESTGRVEFAVANEDEGTDMLGFRINVGEKIVDALSANHTIGWTFVGSGKQAIDGVTRGDYYAAVVIPKDFSARTMSFTTGELKNPKLQYYENKKRNAVMPKITGSAKSALQDEVDAAFIETLGKYITEAGSAAEQAGVEPQDMFGDVSEKMGELGDKMNDCLALVSAAAGLSNAAGELIDASDSLIESSQGTLIAGKQMLDGASDTLPKQYAGNSSAVDSVQQVCDTLQRDLTIVGDDLTDSKDDMKDFNQFVDKKLDKRKALVKKMKDAVDKVIRSLKKLGLTALADRFTKISERLGSIYDKLDKLEKASDTNWEDTKLIIDEILDDIDFVKKSTNSINYDVAGQIDGKIDEAIRETRATISRTKDSLSGTYGKLDNLSSALSKSEKTLDALDGGILNTLASLNSVRDSFYQLSKMFDSLASSDKLKDINVLLTDSSEVIAENLASPVKMEEKVFYATDTYGSAISPFYTTLALWVGALFTAVFIKAEVRRRKEDEPEAEVSSDAATGDEAGPRIEAGTEPSPYEKYFGRLRVYLYMGIAQAVLIMLGNLFYCGIDCQHPWLLLLAACVTALTYATINFVLRYLFDEIGLAISVILVLLQVAGSGGTYPTHVLPQIFQKLYPFMPFRYSMDAMRECIAGMYGNTYMKCLGALLIFILVFLVVGLLLRRPAHALNHRISDSLEKCELME